MIYKYKKASFNCTGCDIPYCDIPCTILSVDESKQCALIAVDEILELLPEIAFGNRVIKFYEEVKQEILTYGGNK